MLAIKTIYMEPHVEDFARGREILARWPDAERVIVPSHWKIDGLHGNAGSVRDWVRIKRDVLVLGTKKSLALRPNSRSSDFIAPSHSNGCAMACAYCYVPRRKGFANPITTFVNIEQILAAIERHAGRQGSKPEPSQTDPEAWVYDIGEQGDCSLDATISDNVRDLVALFRRLPNAKASFATKFVNRDLLTYDPQGRTRVRFSLMPAGMARVVDVRTSRIEERIGAIDDFVEAGYEVHLNFSPVILYDGWERDYDRLLHEVGDRVSPRARAQLKAEVIMLTHNKGLHEVNLGWHPKAEALLWRPEWQQPKRSQTGGLNLRYRNNIKARAVDTFRELLGRILPECTIRYAF